MNIGSYSYEEYLHLVKSFHGNLAPGLIIGGFMVDLALKELPEGELFDAMCETPVCLPDAVQILTPCTIGNGWLKIVNFGRFALALYEKNEGQGIRVYMDSARLEPWPEIKSWFFKLKSSHAYSLLVDDSNGCACGNERIELLNIGIGHAHAPLRNLFRESNNRTGSQDIRKASSASNR
ncbi:MAG: formylmethanofuran dehydrogenase subunit E family protein [Deltaproteobacteria bacterium]|nr:formylmethanofuran dehydrogenase subunit E family protein [Deltaproteobacteria bacterium]